MMQCVVVIGVGFLGFVQLCVFQFVVVKGDVIFEVVCFEKQLNWGGLWNYIWCMGVDEYGELVYGLMYCYFWLNGFKEGFEFVDYFFEEYFGKQIVLYLSCVVMFDYIEGWVNKVEVCDWIWFFSVVCNVVYDVEGDNFIVIVYDQVNDWVYFEVFDWVVVVLGYFLMLNMLEYLGFEWFNGCIVYVYDFCDVCVFKGQDVLLIGMFYFVEDIGL